MKSHHSLLAWQKARDVTRIVLSLSTSSWKPQFAAVFSQLQRSSLSVQLNIAEGYAFTRSPSQNRHLRIAYGSAIETFDLLSLLGEHDYFDKLEIAKALDLCVESQQLLFGLMRKCGALNEPHKASHSGTKF